MEILILMISFVFREILLKIDAIYNLYIYILFINLHILN